MERERFEALVTRALANLSPGFEISGKMLTYYWAFIKLCPKLKRGRGYGMVLPDKISIFQKPIEAQCLSDKEIEVKIGEVVRHEIAHHFGTDEKTLRRIEGEKWRSRSTSS